MNRRARSKTSGLPQVSAEQIIPARSCVVATASHTMMKKRKQLKPQQQPSKVIVVFLDIDGVLLPFSGAHQHSSSCGGLFPDRNVEALSRIFEAIPEAELVLSSTWRVTESLQLEIINSLRAYGYAFGCAPLMNLQNFYDITDPGLHSERQHEIYAWLSKKNDSVKAWVALDDEELIKGKVNAKHRELFEHRAVLTESHVGLTLDNAEKAIKLLRDQMTKSK